MVNLLVHFRVVLPQPFWPTKRFRLFDPNSFKFRFCSARRRLDSALIDVGMFPFIIKQHAIRLDASS